VNALLLSLRCLLALVFLVAAIGKLLDPVGSRQALEEFGVLPRIARIGGLALPVAELAVAVALLLRPSARWGAGGALVLLLAFIAGVARAMSQGRSPECHCFGQIHSEKAGPSTLIRNAILAAPAAFIIAAGTGPSLNGALAGLNAAQVALVATSVVAVLLALAVVQLWSDRRRLQRELEAAIAAKAPAGLPRGTPAPEFALTPVRGNAGSLGELMDPGRPTVLVFVSTNCGPCLQMLPSLARWQDSLVESLALPAIFAGERADIERISAEQDLRVALAQEDNEAFGLYNLRATPSAVLISAGGAVASAPAEGVPAIEALIRTAVAQSRPDELVLHQA
jgi:thiol-disulfide isomerase/thioredoxin/uncharacterized membrane protein YphA (DoxX/SURF4 family)